MRSATPFLCFCCPPEYTQLALDYWSGGSAEGTWAWEFSLDQITQRHTVLKKEILKRVNAAAVAVNLARRCVGCGTPQEISSRTALLQMSYGDHLCGDCRKRERDAEQKAKMDAEEQRRGACRAQVSKISQQNQTYGYEYIGYAEAVIAFAIMVTSDEACEDGSFHGEDVAHLCSSKQLVADLLWRLFNSGVLRILDSTKPEALELREGSWLYYPLKINWQFAVDADGRSYPEVMRLLGEVIDQRESNPEFGGDVEELWTLLAYDDALSYLLQEVDEYRLPDVRVGPKTEQALRHALEYFSIPQVRREITNVVKNAAALAQHRDYHRRQALNTIPGTLISYVDRAVSEGWNLTPIHRNWQNEEPVLLTILFNRVLGTGLPGFKTLSRNMLVATYVKDASIASA